MPEELHVVTGAFSYTGKYIARRLLAEGKRVRTLARRPGPDPFGGAVEFRSLDFASAEEVARQLEGAAVLYNTYWIRFPRGGMTFEKAVENNRMLIRAAEMAGTSRMVHLSVSNPSEHSPLGYFRGKALQEKALRESKLSWAIVRPTLTFGKEDILVNNIAWLIRKFPVFPMPGRGDYRVQPVFVDDVAAIAVEAGARRDNYVIDAAGPETYTFEEMVGLLAGAMGRRINIPHLPPGVAVFLASLVSMAVRDVIITREEITAIMDNLLVSSGPPTGRASFRQWITDDAVTLGARYASETARHWR